MSELSNRVQQSLMDDRSAVERFMQEYDQILRDAIIHRDENDRMRLENANLLSEVNMLREAMQRSEDSRIRLERMTSALVARLGIIQDTIDTAARDAIKEATEEPPKRAAATPEAAPTPVRIPATKEDPIDDAALRDLVQRLPRVTPL